MPINRVGPACWTVARSTSKSGHDVSLANLFLAPVMFYVGLTPEGEKLLSGRTHLAAWYQRMSERESFVATLPPLPQAAA